ncbi:type VII secretion protein EccB [Nocardioides sp. SYSU DS0651]|uniref:type VII secretion protein EccB n=1 Tax=Nocardioides sp. SYSU DS0651 TaxID=3415955 RepID=UPI003F4BD120
MATKKDLVEAYAFSRRRLVTAFVSGAPGGREVEPARPARMIVGGAALAVLLVAGAAVAGALSDRADVDWDEPGLVTDDSGALYVILDEEDTDGEPLLRPVINVTSAQLILGSEESAQKVPTEEIAGARKGSPIGILGAPATVPPSSELVNTGWTACTGDGLGIKAHVGDDGEVRSTPRTGFVVRGARSRDHFLLAEAPAAEGMPARAYRYAMPDREDQQVYQAIGVATPSEAPTVPEEWLGLFPQGGPLDVEGLGIAGWGERVDRATRQEYGFPAGARYGDWFQSGPRVIAVARDGFVELSSFAAAVLQSTPLAGRFPEELPRPTTATFGEQPYLASHWPEELLEEAPRDVELCGVLETSEGEEPAARLAVEPEGAASAEAVPANGQEATVDSGHGALVRSADWITDDGGSVHLVDDRGFSYPIASQDEIDRLGYGRVPPVVVPDSWNKLFTAGPELSREAALCPPAAAASARQAQTCS